MQLLKLLVLFLLLFLPLGNIYADAPEWDENWEEEEEEVVPQSWEDKNPKEIIDQVRWGSRSVQDTQLDDVSSGWDWVSWTLESVWESIWPYINWAVFIWLSIAVILLIYNWILLMTTSMNDSVIWKVKTRITYLVIWIVLITWFYFVIAIVVSIIWNIT